MVVTGLIEYKYLVSISFLHEDIHTEPYTGNSVAIQCVSLRQSTRPNTGDSAAVCGVRCYIFIISSPKPSTGNSAAVWWYLHIPTIKPNPTLVI